MRGGKPPEDEDLGRRGEGNEQALPGEGREVVFAGRGEALDSPCRLNHVLSLFCGGFVDASLW